MEPLIIGLIGIFLLFVLLFLGMPIGYALAFIGFSGIWYLTSFEVAMPTVARSFYSTFTNYSFTVIPLFVVMGELASISGMSRGIYEVADKWLRRLPGGLAIATIGACAGFSAICGSSVATAATLGKVALPEMDRFGYDIRLSTGSVAAGGTLGFLIPPSIGFVVYGILTEQSVGKLLISGFLPGFFLTAAYMAIIVAWVRLNPKIAPADTAKVSWMERVIVLKKIWELITAFILVMGGIYLGFFTPTEAGAIGAFFLFIIALLKKKLNIENLVTAFKETVKISVMIFMILAGAYVFTYFMALTMIPLKLASWLTGLHLSKYAILAVIILIYLSLGCFLDATSMMVLTLPVIFPAVIRLGFDPIWFGVIAVLMMEAGLITPPLGLNVFVISGIAGVRTEIIFGGALRFVAAIFAIIILITIFPNIVLFLPNMMR